MPSSPLVDESIPSVSAVANFSLSLSRIPAILAVPVCLLCLGQAYTSQYCCTDNLLPLYHRP